MDSDIIFYFSQNYFAYSVALSYVVACTADRLFFEDLTNEECFVLNIRHISYH